MNWRSAFPFRTVHVAALALCAIMLPWSTAFLSIAQMLLAANWLAEGIVHRDLGGRFKRAFSSAPVLVFLGFLGLYMLGLLWTSDTGWGFDLVRILAPVLVFGVILGGSPRLSASELRTVLLFGAWSAIVSSLACAIMAAPDADFRALARFVSHIRLAMMLVFAIVVFVWYSVGAPLLLRVVHLLAAIWAISFLSRLGSVQGVVMLATIIGIFLWHMLRSRPPFWRIGLRAVLALVPVIVGYWLYTQVFSEAYEMSTAQVGIPELTAGGEPYVHVEGDTHFENGRPVWSHVAWGEMRRTWERRSALHIDSLDAKGHVVKGTLARYLTSLGQYKDSVGVMSLSEEDIRRVEQGITSVQAGTRNKLLLRLDGVRHELQRYRSTGDANGHSVTQRLEYWRTGMAIVRDHWLFGVGTGDTQRAFDAKYDEMNSSLLPEWRHRAHNQYLTLWISFGVFGLLFALFSWWWPAWELGAWRDPFFIAWAIIFGISCLTDDTVETQTGVTFFALYYALLVFAAPRYGLNPADPMREAHAPE